MTPPSDLDRWWERVHARHDDWSPHDGDPHATDDDPRWGDGDDDDA